MKKTFLALCLAGLTISAMARDNWVSGSGHPIRDSLGECIRNGVWTPATANPECIRDLAPKTVAAAPKPVISQPQTQPPVPPAAPAVVVTSKMTFQAETLFDFDRSVIKPQGRAVLDGFVTSLNGSRAKYDLVIVVGHTDSVGSDDYNMRLGLRRAEAVKAYLVSAGMAANTIKTSSSGERRPVADNKTAAGRAQNRRVEITVTGIVTK